MVFINFQKDLDNIALQNLILLTWALNLFLNGNQRFKISLNNLFSPFSFDPGSLLLQEANEDRSMARASNIEFESGESCISIKI